MTGRPEILSGEQIVGAVVRVRRSAPPRPRAGSNPWYWLGLALLLGYDLVPIWGVRYAGWSAFGVLFLFWLETVVLGCFDVHKLRLIARQDAIRGHRAPSGSSDPTADLAGGPWDDAHPWEWAAIIFAFAAISGAILFGLFWRPDISALPTALALLGLLASEAIGHRRFLERRSYRTARRGGIAGRQFARILVLWFAVLGGGLVAKAVEDPGVPVLVLASGKTLADLILGLARAFSRSPSPES